MPKAVLLGLKKYPVRLISITSMLESGGSTGQLREDLNVLPAGDISRHLVALSDAPLWKKNIFLFRFGREKFPGGHIGHRFGTVFIAGLEYLLKDFEAALKISHEFLEIKRHRALPATIKITHAWAVLENGKIIKGEDEIDVPKRHSGKLKIKKIYLKPSARAYPPVLDEIKKADLIVFGPGDLYSSIIPCLLPRGMKEAIQKTGAKKIFICNLMTKYGETANFTVSDFINEFERYLGRDLDFAIYNNYFPEKKKIQNYRKEHPELLEMVKISPKLDKKKFIGKNLLKKGDLIEHDPGRVAKVIFSLI